MTAEMLLAALLLTSPPNSTTLEPIAANLERLPAPVPDAWLAVLRPSLLALAMDAEVLDPREVGAGFDLAFLQGRHQQFRDAPYADEALRFPPVPWINDAMRINRMCRGHLAGRLLIDEIFAGELREGVACADRAYQAYDLARGAQSPVYYVTPRREWLRELRGLIGSEAFERGLLPAGVPLNCVPREEQPQPDWRIPKRLPVR